MTARTNPSTYMLSMAVVSLLFLWTNYISWFVAAPAVWHVGAAAGLVATALLFIINGGVSRYLVLRIIVLLLLVISLGSPATGWDARSIWLFNAKRIIFGNSLFAAMDGYQPVMHGDYPSMVPSLTVSLAMLAGTWNEIFPKTSAIFAWLPALYILAAPLRSNMQQLALGALLLLVGGGYLINGYMDAVLAIYTAAAALCVHLVLTHPRALLMRLAAVMIWAALGLIKSEGLIILLLLMAAVLVARRGRISWKLLLAMLFSLAPALFWHWVCAINNVGNDMLGPYFMQHALANMAVAKHYAIVLWYMFGRNFFVLLVPAAAFALVALRSRDYPFVPLFAGFYCAALIVIYFFTPHDFLWHVYTSANRVVLPVGLVLGYFALLAASHLAEKPEKY